MMFLCSSFTIRTELFKCFDPLFISPGGRHSSMATMGGVSQTTETGLYTSWEQSHIATLLHSRGVSAQSFAVLVASEIIIKFTLVKIKIPILPAQGTWARRSVVTS